ncbi:nucleoside recognition domain-containing protein, partial [Flavobacterium filum]|uniref:nucleoside recognition domain-containing protein n=1 Tax=Flavobacterium filum TaxID=370974 RepID=UPI0023F0DAE7
WLSANVQVGDVSFAQWFVTTVDPFALFLGLNGVILLAYIIAIPANEIVIPTVLMLTVLTGGIADAGAGAGVMFELDSVSATASILHAGGWTLLTGINLMLFSLLHNPCSTTIYTIYKETGSVKWTVLSVAIPLVMGFFLTAVVAVVYRAIFG